MSPETRTRVVRGLLTAALPALAITQVASYSWSGADQLAIHAFVQWPWWVGSLAVFVALVLAAGFVAIGAEESDPISRSHGREMRLQTRFRIAWVLFTAALIAYFFYRTAFASWFDSLPVLISFRFLSFQDWRWWVGAGIAGFGLFLAAVVVMGGGIKSRTLPVTPLDDPSHELRLDEHGDEIGPAPDSDLGGAWSYAPAPQQDPLPAPGRSETPRVFRASGIPWIRAAVAATTVLLAVHFWRAREISVDYAVILALTYALSIVYWWLARVR